MKPNTELRIFIAEEDSNTLQMYQQHLGSIGYHHVFLFEDGNVCLNHMHEQPDVIFLDQRMRIQQGVEILKKIKAANPDIYVVFISGADEIQSAVTSLKYGAFDFIVKGTGELNRLDQVLSKISELWQLLLNKRKQMTKIINQSRSALSY
jgi:polysaccharide export outer membrane protein